MVAVALQDIDELVLTCRSPRTRALIAEAVACYKSGAYRACVVATWVAIMYDVIGKLEELEAAGSKPAGAMLTPLREAQATPEAEREAGQTFERTVLERLTGADLELISHQERLDLKRILEDRHRCAHPSMSAAFEPYAMSAEQARTHLRNAITCLLQHPPAQGKFAKDRIFALIQSDLFPEDVAEATERLRHTALPGGRAILVKEVVLGLCTDLLRQDRPPDERRRQFAALAAARILRKPDADGPLSQNLSAYVESIDAARLGRAVEFIGHTDDTWHLLDAGQQARLVAYVSVRAPQLGLDVLLAAASVAPLRAAIEARAHELPPPTLAQILQALDLPIMVDEAIKRFADAGSFAEAISAVKNYLVPSAAKLTADQLGQALKGYTENNQVYSSFGVASALAAVLAGAAPAARAYVDPKVSQQAIARLDAMAANGWAQPEHATLRGALAG